MSDVIVLSSGIIVYLSEKYQAIVIYLVEFPSYFIAQFFSYKNNFSENKYGRRLSYYILFRTSNKNSSLLLSLNMFLNMLQSFLRTSLNSSLYRNGTTIVIEMSKMTFLTAPIS